MSLLLASALMMAAPERLAAPADYRLVWADEFAEAGLPNRERWGYDTAYNRQGWHNDEAQYYAASRAKNARVERGRMIVEAHSEQLDRRRYPDWGKQDFTSARLVTKGRAAWRYGFFEIRAKLPCARGTWPAIWMLPADAEARWRNGEIDIMEHVGHEPGSVHHSLHTARQNFRRGNHLTARSEVTAACNAFHLYQLHWTPERIVVGVNGKPALSYSRTDVPPLAWPFDRPFYLIINVAVGGTWGGAKGIDQAALPSSIEVDYVRVWQRPPTA